MIMMDIYFGVGEKMKSNIDPFYLIHQGKFNEAIRLYTEELEKELSSPTLANRGLAYLNTGDFDKALIDFKKADEIDRIEIIDRTDGYLQLIGMTLWLKGQEKEAAEQWYNLVQEIDAGKIVFSDMAGGVINGTLLWFAACFNDELSEYKEKAEKYLKKKAKLSRAKYWPGPIGPYLLGNLSEEDLKLAAHHDNEILKNRHLCQAYFYIGVKAFSNGDMESFRKAMAESIERGRHNLIEKEYYLAKHELSRRA